MKLPEAYMDRRHEGDTTLRQAQLVILHLLHVLDAICKDHNIQYWLAWGSCLGALRHDGFIPWDDDLDVGMTVDNYKKLLKVLPSALPDDVMLQRPEDYPHIAICFAKIRDKKSFCHESRSDTTLVDPSGLYIDLFPFEEVPAVGKNLAWLLIKTCGSTFSRQKYFLGKASRSIANALVFLPVAIGCAVLNKLAHMVVFLLKKVLPCHHLSDCFDHGETRLYKKEWFSSTVLHKFEDGMFPVPIGAEDYLNARYGNWRQVPPPEMRPQHARIIDPFQSAQ